MDGTTRAAEFCSFMPTTDTQYIAPPDSLPKVIDKGNGIFEVVKEIKNVPTERLAREHLFRMVVKSTDRCYRMGRFNKPWILVPLNTDRTHWVFVALLNVAYLGTSQQQKFSGFFVYDSLHPNSTREQDLTILHNKGILNLVIYANLVYGNPRLTTKNIRDICFDPNQFARICVPEVDTVKQVDGCNCGLFVWMNCLEFSTVHSRHYQHMKDFDQFKTEKDGTEYHLKKGDFFKLYRNPNKAPTPNSRIPDQVFLAIRNQAQCLSNRIMTLKWKVNLSPRTPTQSLPKYVSHNFRRHVWDIPDENQKGIDDYQNWVNKGDQAGLKKLLQCDNPVVTNADKFFISEIVDDEETEDDNWKVTIDEMAGAGVQEVITILEPGDDDFLESNATLNSVPKRKKQTPALGSSQEPSKTRLRLSLKGGTPSKTEQVRKEEGKQYWWVSYLILF